MRFTVLIMYLAVSSAWTVASRAQAPTPLDAVLPAGETSLIASPVPTPETAENRPVLLMHYRLHLPADYHQTGDRKYPVMFVAGPSGNAAMGKMRDALVRGRWIVAMLVESRNGSNLWLPNFTTAYDDLVRRVRAQSGMIFCTGLSGAAKVCSVYPGIRPGFRGMILQAAGPWGARVFAEPGNGKLLVYGTFGTMDPNFHHARRMRVSMPTGIRRLVEIWDGGHAWAPSDVFERALDWIERAALLDDPHDHTLADAYRWYAENKLADYVQAKTDIARYAALINIQALPTAWRKTADRDLVERIDVALATLAAPPAGEIAAFDTFHQALREDEDDGGRNPETIAGLYQAIAEQYPETAYGAKAAARQQAVWWETGQYP